MNKAVKNHAETATHLRLKRLALLWAQGHGYSACALEVTLPRCRYRADVAAYRPDAKGIGSTVIFECKQARPDLRCDGCSAETAERLETIYRRRQVLEKHFRIHYPALLLADSLFAEFDSYNFGAIEHRGYAHVVRKMSALQNRLFDCTKFEKLVRYRCANLFFLVLPNDLFRESEIPFGWGALIDAGDALSLARKATSQEIAAENRVHFLARIAAAGTRMLNRQVEITFDDVRASRCRSCA